MVRYVSGRIGYMLVTLFIIAATTFLLMEFLPGSPFNSQKLSPDQLQILEEKYNLDDPLPVRFADYIIGLVQGDLGVSLIYEGREITDMILNRLPASMQLGYESIIVGTVFGLLFGIIAALRHNTFVDYGTMVLAVLGISVPAFVLAGVMQYYIGVKLQWLPVAFWEGPKYHIMPVIALAVFVVATIARFMRTEMLEVLGQDYITLAKAKGISSSKVVFWHAIRNSLIPIITIMGPLVVSLMTGTLVIEKIFAVPGIGDLFVESISRRDYPLIMGITMFYSFLLLAVILIVDILYGIVDPRIRLAGGKD